MMTNRPSKKPKEKIYGNRIREFLLEMDMNIAELSDITKLPPSHLSRIINGQRRCISLPIAFKISEALDKSIEEIFLAKAPKRIAKIEDDNN
jgi:plasmid maintenance system antidote protein VapI